MTSLGRIFATRLHDAHAYKEFDAHENEAFTVYYCTGIASTLLYCWE